MSSTPRLIGTLIVVVLKAKNLPNKRHIGKQDPYCTLKLHADTKRTKAVKRGGQHPEWDEEIRFELFEDIEDELARTSRAHRGDGSAPPSPPPKDPNKERKVKGGKTMRLLCYADDPREPELIGETIVDLTEVLKKGETDEWFSLLNKDKYSGEVYLEMTFWSNDKPPEKKHADRPSNLHPQYGGPGSFTPSDGAGRVGRGSSGGSSPAPGDRMPYHGRQSSASIDGKGSISGTSSLAQLNLYIPPYDQSPPHHHRKYDPSMEFGDPSKRRDSYPPHNARPQTNYGYPGAANFGPPANPNPYDVAAPAPDPYANGSPSSTYYQSSQSAAFTNSLYQSNPPVASGFIPPQPAMTPVPSGFQPIYSGFAAPRPAATPIPSFAPPPSSMGFHGYQQPPNPSMFPSQTPIPQANQPMPPFQHHPNSFPSAVPPPHNQISGLPFSGSITTAPTPVPQFVPQQHPVYQQPAQTGQGRPLPDQPPQQQQSLPNPAFPNAVPYNHGQTPPQPPSQVLHQNSGPQGLTTPGFIPPPPPPPINQPNRATSLPTQSGTAPLPPTPANNGYSNPPLPVPPQQPPSHQQTPSQHNTGPISANNTGGSGRSGLPLPPLPNPPGQVQSAFYTGPPPPNQGQGATNLPGPPPSLKPGFVPQQQQQQQPLHQQPQHQQQSSLHQQQPSYGNTGYAQPQYGAPQQQQYQPQPPQQSQLQQQGVPWQPYQQQYTGGLAAPGQQYVPGQPSPTPQPQFGAYPPPPQVQTPWYS